VTERVKIHARDAIIMNVFCETAARRAYSISDIIRLYITKTMKLL